nr:YwqG family protein [Streptomyces sp. NBC_00998]
MSTTTLLVHDGSAAPDTPVTRIGGLPLAPSGTRWPTCAACSGPLQFIAQIVLDGGRGVLSVFMCANDPGMCGDWSATAGGNRAYLFPSAGLVPLPLPALPTAGDDDDEDDDEDEDVRQLGAVRTVERVTVAEPEYRLASKAWSEQSGRPANEVLGQLGGTADWLQNDETPDCTGCGRPMEFVARLDEGPDPLTAPNFGSGSAYAHACEPCGRAAFLWQC